MDASLPPTRLAILRTLGPLHSEPLRYDLEVLRALVMQLAPDLLCADLTREAWEHGDLEAAPLEIRQALLPAIELTDTVLVPVAPDGRQFGDYRAPFGLRSALARRLDGLLRWGQRAADSPEGIHGMAFDAFCHTVCALEEMTWQKDARRAYQQRTRNLTDNILAAIRRDPGGRVLVVVQCQWHHRLEPLLKKQAGDWLQIVDYREL